MSTCQITALGNAGFRIESAGKTLLIDAFHGAVPGVAGASILRPENVGRADLILVTHAHYDHFLADQTAQAAASIAAKVVGPQAVVKKLSGLLPSSQLVELEPKYLTTGRPDAQSVDLAGVKITALRTFHTREHNSYLIETAEHRFFHDGDNEQTDRLPLDVLAKLDVLMIAPWLGSHWSETITALAARCWLLMHLTEDEIAQERRGQFLSQLCSTVPPGLVLLGPGETWQG